jgi:ectoine hydroxylase-related dioxygenase (phytanoyl-CoA dioxygenase family)
MTDFSRHFEELETRGFTIVPGVVPAAALPSLRAQLDAALAADQREFGGRPGKKEALVLELVTRGDAFVELLENETMHRVFSHFLGETCILYSYTSTILRPEDRPAASSIHTDTPRLIPGYHAGIVMTLAIDDFTVENGATYYLPGSHRSMQPPKEEAFYREAVQVVREAGDAVFFHPRVYHAGGVNRTPTTRYGLTVYACRSFMRQRFDYPRLVTPAILARLSERGRGFLGFNVRVPVNQDQFYVPESERLYRGGQG